MRGGFLSRFCENATSYGGAINWFPGHMAKGLRQIGDRVKQVDVVLEVRDARIPLSSVNPEFESLVEGRRRVIVYNKADLANANMNQRVVDIFTKENTSVIFTNALSKSNKGAKKIETLMRTAVNLVPKKEFKTSPIILMVVGIPNVGKSQIINALRYRGLGRGGIAHTGAVPGITRSLNKYCYQVCAKPPVYLFDTPGVMLPRIASPHMGMLLSLTGAIKDSIVGEDALAEFLFDLLNESGIKTHQVQYECNRDVSSMKYHEFIKCVERRYGCNEHSAARAFVADFRRGTLGRFTLDTLPAAP